MTTFTIVITYLPKFKYPWRVIFGEWTKTFTTQTEAIDYIAKTMNSAEKEQEKP